MEILWVVLGIVLLVVILLALRSMTQVVPHEERRCVYRLGRFHRVVGPGLVLIVPGLDRVERTYRVRDQPLEVTVDGLFAFGVPVSITLNLWCRFDLTAAAGQDRARLADLVHLADSERRQQVEVKVRASLVRQLAALQESDPVPGTASLRERVGALAPGSRRHNKLLEAVKQELRETLPMAGAILDTSQPIVLTRRSVPDDIIQAMSRMRGREIDSEWLTGYAARLRQQFPDISNAVLAQMLASIEGVDVGRIQRLLVGHDADSRAAPDVDLELEMSGDSTHPNVIAKPKMKEGRGAEAHRAERREAGEQPERTAPATLTKEDLALLKRVPRRSDNQRRSA